MTSPTKGMTFPGTSFSDAANSSRRSFRRATAIMFAPSLANRSTIAFPIPEDAPVIHHCIIKPETTGKVIGFKAVPLQNPGSDIAAQTALADHIDFLSRFHLTNPFPPSFSSKPSTLYPSASFTPCLRTSPWIKEAISASKGFINCLGR